MTFENSRALLLLIIFPFLLCGLGFWGWAAKKEIAEMFRLNLAHLKRSQAIKYLLAGLLLALLAGALALPEIPLSSAVAQKRTGEILLLVDVSASMAAQPNENSLHRLARVKPILFDVIDRMDTLRDVKISLCGFTSIARSLVPFVDREDYPYLKESITRVLSFNAVPGSGSIFGRSLLNVLDKFTSGQEAKLIVIFSDGEPSIGLSQGVHEVELNFIREAVDKARDEGIKVITVGVGEREGAKIPLYDNGRFTGEYAQMQGTDYVSTFDESLIRQIASQTGGEYFFESDRKGIMDFIEQNLAITASQELVQEIDKVYRSIAHWLLLAVLPLWVFFVRRYLF